MRKVLFVVVAAALLASVSIGIGPATAQDICKPEDCLDDGFIPTGCGWEYVVGGLVRTSPVTVYNDVLAKARCDHKVSSIEVATMVTGDMDGGSCAYCDMWFSSSQFQWFDPRPEVCVLIMAQSSFGARSNNPGDNEQWTECV